MENRSRRTPQQTVFHDGFMYYTSKRCNGTRYLRCTKYRQTRCQASGKIEESGVFMLTNGQHNHENLEDQIQGRNFKSRLRDACTREKGNLKNIYERLATKESQYTFIDGTFKVVSKRPGFSQILIIFAVCMDHAFPIFHIFMERKTRALYDAVFAYLSRTFNTFINRTIFTDYEAALVTSLRACYPEATLKGCFFIFVRKWILRDTPGHFSVFRHRYKTNNVIESYHKQLNSRLVRYPRIWDLIENLIEIQNIAILELEQLERQEQVFRIATKNSVFNSRVNEAWNNLENGRFTIGDFLRQAEHFVADFDEYLDVRHEKVLPIPSSEAQPLLIQNEAPPLIFFRPPKVTPVLRLNLREMKPPSLIFFKTRPKPPLHDFSQNPSSLDDPLKPSLHNFPQDPLLRDDPPKPSFYHFPRSPISPDDPPKPSLYHFPQIPISPEDPPKPSLYHFPQNPLLLDDPPKPP